MHPLPDGSPLAVLGLVLDEEHVLAVATDRNNAGVPLTTADAVAIADFVDAYSDPNLAAEALVANRYRGCRTAPLPRPMRKPAKRAKQTSSLGDINRRDEPEAFAKAIELSGWTWRAEWAACRFPDHIARRARLLVTPAGNRFRVVAGGRDECSTS